MVISSKSKIKSIATPRSAKETIDDDPTLGESNSNNFKFDLSKISQKEILLDETSNDKFLTKQSILETDISEKNNNNNNTEIIINIKRAFYTNVKIMSIESPQKITANDPTKVTKEELKTALLPEILKELEKLNSGFPNAVNIKYISIKEFEIENLNFPLDLSSEKILTKFNIIFKFISGVMPVLVFAPDINLNNFSNFKDKY